ncbi:tetratricopeptide repeat protein, partial [bacterium]|nr:tetratricopeptide repeat protein [bacterium]
MSKKTFRKLFLIFILLCVVALLFLHSDWTKRQYDKGLSAFYVYRGDRAYKKRDLQGAINYYSLALDLYPEHYEARYNLGNIYVVYEDYNDAVDSYKIALEDKPDFNVARMNLGIVTAEKLGNFDEAIADYQQIINNQPRLFSIPFLFSNRKSAKLNRGIAYYNMGVAYRQKAIYEDSNDSLKRSQNLQNAVDSYMSASKILKKDFDTFYN